MLAIKDHFPGAPKQPVSQKIAPFYFKKFLGWFVFLFFFGVGLGIFGFSGVFKII